MVFLFIAFGTLKGAEASISSVTQIYTAISENIKEHDYEAALGKAKLYRLNYLGKNKILFKYKILLAEAYILKKFCLDKQSSQLIDLIEFYSVKYDQKINIKRIRKDLDLLSLAEHKIEKTNYDFYNSYSLWPIEVDQIKSIKSYESLKIQLESKC
jgi:hypothetical protein